MSVINKRKQSSNIENPITEVESEYAIKNVISIN